MSKVKLDKQTLVTYLSTKGAEYQVPQSLKDSPSVSHIIRTLYSDGWSKWQIHKVTGILYQHVRNVLEKSIKK